MKTGSERVLAAGLIVSLLALSILLSGCNSGRKFAEASDNTINVVSTLRDCLKSGGGWVGVGV